MVIFERFHPLERVSRDSGEALIKRGIYHYIGLLMRWWSSEDFRSLKRVSRGSGEAFTKNTVYHCIRLTKDVVEVNG